MSGNYFFMDGSALAAQIRTLRKADPSFTGRKLCPKRFIDHFMTWLTELHGGAYKRATFYFPTGDESVVDKDYLVMPERSRPGEVRDMHFKFCGEKLKKSGVFDALVEAHIPDQFRDRVSKSEKGIDIEICCDALKLASASEIDRLFLLTNDRDFIPLCKTLKEFGANISLIHLSKATNPSVELLKEVDSYDLVPFETLQAMFLPVPQTPPPPPQVTNVLSAEKPEAAPSDMKVEAAPSDLKLEASFGDEGAFGEDENVVFESEAPQDSPVDGVAGGEDTE